MSSTVGDGPLSPMPATTTARRLPRWSELRPLIGGTPALTGARARRIARAASIEDLRRLARRRAPRAVFDYTDGGAAAEVSLRRSREAFGRVEFRPSVLRDVSEADTTTTLLGRPASLPLGFAPTGFTRMMHTQGEPAVARAAGRAGVPYALSTMGTTSLGRWPERRPGPGGGSSCTSGGTATPASTSSRAPAPAATRRSCSPSTPRLPGCGCGTCATA